MAALVLAAPVAQAQTPDLPEKIPVPEVHEQPAGNVPPDRLGDTPVPEPKPDGDKSPKPPEPSGKIVPPPERAPVPTENPDKTEKGAPDAEPPVENPQKQSNDPMEAAPDIPKIPADPRSTAPRFDVMPPDELACRQRLRALGAEFEEHPPQSDAAGCALPYPIALKTLGKTFAVEPEALMNCAMAEASARFAADIISPAARTAYGEDLKAISNASAYICRPRNGTSKLSEHAFGNAFDIARFTLSKGTAIDVEPAPDAKAAKFLAEIRKAACGPFKTVLGPGSDADHALHFHFDLAPRRNGGTFCQ